MSKKKEKIVEEEKNLAPQKAFIKHLIECKCILPQYKKLDPPIFHKFIVFSELEEQTALVVPSYAQCPNCGIIHRVTEIGRSEFTDKETMLSLPTIEDIEMELPDKMVQILKRHECLLHTWQEVKFIFDNKLWGSAVILTKERDGETVLGKFITIFNSTTYKLDNFSRFEGLV